MVMYSEIIFSVSGLNTLSVCVPVRVASCVGCVPVWVMSLSGLCLSRLRPVQVTSLSELCLSGLRPVLVTSGPGCVLSGLCHSICFGSCRSFKTKKPVTTFCLSIFHFNKKFNLTPRIFGQCPIFCIFPSSICHCTWQQTG